MSFHPSHVCQKLPSSQPRQKALVFVWGFTPSPVKHLPLHTPSGISQTTDNITSSPLPRLEISDTSLLLLYLLTHQVLYLNFQLFLWSQLNMPVAQALSTPAITQVYLIRKLFLIIHSTKYLTVEKSTNPCLHHSRSPLSTRRSPDYYSL